MQNSFKSTCCYCGVGCGVVVHKDKQDRLTLEGDKDHPVNRGMLCSKGMNLHYTVMDKSDRLLYPEMRYNKNSPRKLVTWDEALNRTAAVFKILIEKFGPDSVAFYASGQCLTEEYYVVNKLIKGFIGSNNIDTNSRLCMSSAVVGYKMALGEDSVPVCYDDIELADCFFVTGANPAWCHPILWRRVEAHKEANPDIKIIIADPRRTQTCSIADLHLQLNPGTDVVLNHAIGRILIENNNIDLDFIRNHTEGFEKYRQSVMQRSVSEAAEICGLREADLRLAASYIGDAKGFITMWTMGLNQSVIGVNKNLSLINLNLITGHIGKPGSGPFSLTGQPNAMGGREVGGLCNLLPAHRNLLNPLHRKEVEDFWGGTQISPKPGLTATEMFEALHDGRLKAIWILCTNPLVSLPDVRFAEEALKKAKFVVVQEISDKPETLKYADVILPAATWAEKSGTMTNSERRISYLEKITDAPSEALPDAEIICRFARKMGFKGFDFSSSAEIYEEHSQLTKGTNIDISGLTHEYLKKNGTVQWKAQPSSEGGGWEVALGASRLFTDKKFFTPSQRAIIHSVPDENESEQPNEDFPLILTTGRIRDQWHTRSRTGKVNKLNQHITDCYIEINPEDADSRNLKDGDLAEVFSVRGTVRVKAKVTSDIKKGVVFLPMHWGKILNSDLNRTNNLTHNLLDPISKEPDFKFCAVQVQKYQKPRQKIIVIGAGAGAFGFVKSYRELNQGDEIVIFSKENTPFYNRVLLPDYISGHLPWEQLVKMKHEEERDYNISLKKGISIEKVDKQKKQVIDSQGIIHNYDILILATGSRAATLKDVPALQGVFTMRSRADADALKEMLKPSPAPPKGWGFGLESEELSSLSVKPNSPSAWAEGLGGCFLIIGGGLLGIELAGSLHEIGMKVILLQRTSRLMERQLDTLGSQLLHEEMTNKGIEILYNDEVQTYFGTEKIESIRLKSGRKLTVSAVIMAVGTVPNIELARESGISCKRGVIVDEYLQTSEPDIFAIGEIAEFKGNLYGITAAAEQQASILAKFLNGDIAQFYTGSLLMNILKVQGSEMCSLGMVETPESPDYEEVVMIDKAKRYYKKCIIHQDKLVGAILIGDKSEFLEFKNLIENRTELSEKRLELLRSGKKAEPVIGKLVCTCGNVGEGNIKSKITEGCKDLLQLCQLSGAGMGCGSCRPEVKTILEKQIVSV